MYVYIIVLHNPGMYSITGLLCDRQEYLLLYYQAKDVHLNRVMTVTEHQLAMVGILDQLDRAEILAAKKLKV